MKRGRVVFGASTAVLLAALALLANALITTASPPLVQEDTKTGEEGLPLSVMGYGSVSYSPDKAQVVFNILGDGETAEEALGECSAKTRAVIEALKALGIPEDDMATTRISLNPIYDWDYKPPKIVGYEASYTLRVEVKELEKLGNVIDAAVKAGADSLWGLSFTVSDETLKELRLKAIEAAVDDARDKAEAVASALGMKIVGIEAVNLAPQPQPIFREYYKAEATLEPAPPIIPGEGELTATVFITYILA